uniref:Uncharacterized protein n=1 Tax=Oncorhynchus kisutch TaxID=8019 RepID=A0A8C7CNU9_ONCKI
MECCVAKPSPLSFEECLWWSIGYCKNVLSFTVLPTRDSPRFCQWLAAVNNDAVTKDYQRDFQAKLMGNQFQGQLRSDAIPLTFFRHNKTEESQLEVTMLAILLA